MPCWRHGPTSTTRSTSSTSPPPPGPFVDVNAFGSNAETLATLQASGPGIHYDAPMVAHATTRHAVVAMARQLAKADARFNIRVNTLCPGFIDTP